MQNNIKNCVVLIVTLHQTHQYIFLYKINTVPIDQNKKKKKLTFFL